jgi:hypothetical protein
MEGEYQIDECICLVCNKILKTKGEIILHNYGDHTTGTVQKKKGCGKAIEMVDKDGNDSIFAIACGDSGNYCEECAESVQEVKE